jgi:hypothetical protein
MSAFGGKADIEQAEIHFSSHVVSFIIRSMSQAETARAAAFLLRVAYALAIYHNQTTIHPEDFRAAARALSKLRLDRSEVDISTLIV